MSWFLNRVWATAVGCICAVLWILCMIGDHLFDYLYDSVDELED